VHWKSLLAGSQRKPRCLYRVSYVG
jgi:hypothetical protein